MKSSHELCGCTAMTLETTVSRSAGSETHWMRLRMSLPTSTVSRIARAPWRQHVHLRKRLTRAEYESGKRYRARTMKEVQA
jgi:hypothetical protein